jgi:hypothetical protein
MADRRFSDDEVARILARAVELQAARADVGTNSLTDIEQAAAEAGIDPALVRTAAAEMAGSLPQAQPAPVGFFGPTSVTCEASIDGVLDADGLALVHEVLQHAIALPVTPSTMGRSVQWSYVDPQGGRSVMASITSRDGRTIVRFHERLGGLMGGIYGGVGGGAGGGGVIPLLAIGGAFLLGPVGGVVGGLVGAGLSLFGTRALYLFVARRREARLREAFQRVVEEVSARVVVASTTTTTTATTNAEARQLFQVEAEAPVEVPRR